MERKCSVLSCKEPRVPHSSYCRAHKNAYARRYYRIAKRLSYYQARRAKKKEAK